MKKMLMTVLAVISIGSGSLFAQSENGLIGPARGLSHDCLNNYSGPNWEVWPSVGVVSSCFAGGFITVVNFSARPIVQPCFGEDGEPCNPPPLPIIVATVTFGCDGEVMSSSCY